jgi:anthranilate 1,2-dioxygenase small subunit
MTMDGSIQLPNDARRQIDDLLAEYAHAIDDDRLEEWADFFTDDCSYRMINRENHEKGRVVGIMDCSSKGMLQDRILALREANVFEPHTYRHILSGTRITGRNDGLYKVETSFLVVRIMQEGDMAVFCTGKYIDEITLDGDRPLFRERVVVCDSNRVDTLIVIPI